MSFIQFGQEELTNLKQVIESQSLWRGTAGDFVARFEDAFAKHLGRRYVLALSSGTSANETALAGLGLEPGDEVLCPASAPIFVSMPVVALGCVPVFADTDPRTMIISPEGIEASVTPKARAVVVVHMYGQPAPVEDLLAVATKHNLKVVEDCAQAFDCYHKGKKAGTFGDVTCFSLQQSKHITSGEGGIVATDDPEIYKRAVLYSNCGMPWYRYDLEPPRAEPVGNLLTRGHFAFGHNYRMSELQGAAVLAQLQKIGALNARRKELVEIIETELAGTPNVALAYRYPYTEPNYWAYPLRAEGVTTAELASKCSDRSVSVPRYGEINYLEVVYQRMEAERRTSLGFPVPDYVHYRPGLCPQAELGAQHMMPVGVGPLTDEEGLRKWARDLRATLEGR